MMMAKKLYHKLQNPNPIFSSIFASTLFAIPCGVDCTADVLLVTVLILYFAVGPADQTAVAVAGGRYHTCAILGSGGLKVSLFAECVAVKVPSAGRSGCCEVSWETALTAGLSYPVGN